MQASDTLNAPSLTRSNVQAQMQAITRHAYGGPEVLRFEAVNRPEPEPGQVRVRVRASSINFGDDVLLTGRPWLARLAFGLRRPRSAVPGMDLAGEVEAVGPGVTEFEVGDRVMGEQIGAWAESVCVPIGRLARMPEGLSFEQAGTLPVSAATALQGLRDKAGLKPGRRALIIGASGSVGTFAVQIARALGAEVTGVCSGANAALVRDLGAAHIVDYTTEDWTQTDTRYDAILDLAGGAPFGRCLKVLAPGGTYVASTSHLRTLIKAGLLSLISARVKVLSTQFRATDLTELGEMVVRGDLKPAITHRWPLSATAEAMSQGAVHHRRGKSVLLM